MNPQPTMFRYAFASVFLFQLLIIAGCVQGTLSLTGRQLFALATTPALTVACGCGRPLARGMLHVICWSLGLAMPGSATDSGTSYDLGYDPGWPKVPSVVDVEQAYQQSLARVFPLRGYRLLHTHDHRRHRSCLVYHRLQAHWMLSRPSPHARLQTWCLQA